MRLVKVKTLREKDWSRGTIVYRLIQKGKLKAYRNQNNELMYDRDEYNAYRKVNHRGRPLKQETTIKVDLRRGKRNVKNSD